MDKTKVESYEAPKVEVIEVTVEHGFAASNGFGDSSVSGWGDGGIYDGSFEI